VVINNLQAYDDIWNWIYEILHFRPCGLDKGHVFPYGPPFQIPFPYVVYGIEQMTEEQLDIMDEQVQQAFLNVTKEGQCLYALDWQHSGFLYDPRSSDAYKSAWVEDARFPQGGYMAFFPPFYPNGDYYFFIDENLQFGYLSHPWREEVWVFGENLIKEFDRIYSKLGWFKLQFEV